MYSSNFDYYRARSLADAHALMAAHPGAKVLAGGHSLLPLLKLRLAAPLAVVDIGRVPELRGITRQGDRIDIGALTTHAELASSADLRAAAPALSEAAAMIGDPAVRNRGTIGGNVAHADPASDLPTVLVALNARVIVAGPNGQRSVPAEEFFTGIMMTALEDNEILTAVQVPASVRGQGSAYEKFSHPGVAICRHRRRRAGLGEGRQVRRGARRDRRSASQRPAGDRGRGCAHGKSAVGRDDRGGSEPRRLGPRQ